MDLTRTALLFVAWQNYRYHFFNNQKPNHLITFMWLGEEGTEDNIFNPSYNEESSVIH
jgi:hypothetical protein